MTISTTTESATNRFGQGSPFAVINRRVRNRGLSELILCDLSDAGLRIVRECVSCEGSGEAVADIIDGYHRYDICEQCGGTGIALDQFRIFSESDDAAARAAGRSVDQAAMAGEGE